MKLQRERLTMVRLYLSEERSRMEKLLDLLHEREKLRGVTVFRAISGYGESGELHTATRIDLSLNLPLVVEFFDAPEKIERVVGDLLEWLGPVHVVTWEVEQIAGS